MKYDSLDPEALANHLECESLLVLERVSSTQDLLHELATEGAPSGSVVLTDEQVRGRGRQSRGPGARRAGPDWHRVTRPCYATVGRKSSFGESR